MRVLSLYAAILVYAGFSSPTPDLVGPAEIISACLLAFALWDGRFAAMILHPAPPAPLGYHRAFLLITGALGLCLAAINAQAPGDMIRDIIPFALLILPFYAAVRADHLSALGIVMIVAGFSFAARYLAGLSGPLLPRGWNMAGDQSLLYLANAPLVAYAAVAGSAVLFGRPGTGLSARIAGFMVTGVCFAAMAMMVQRAPLTLSLCACLGVIAIRTVHMPLRSAVTGAIVLTLLLPGLAAAIDIYQTLTDKTWAVGWNNRIVEWREAALYAGWFGHGWGASWPSPAVGDYMVRYTHAMPTYYWLKAGMAGLALAVGLIIVWGKALARLAAREPVLALSVGVPFFVHLFLYTGYKTFDFALLLSLVTVSLCKNDRRPS